MSNKYPKSCSDAECNMRSTCIRYRGEGTPHPFVHKVDINGNKYCSEYLTQEHWNKNIGKRYRR